MHSDSGRSAAFGFGAACWLVVACSSAQVLSPVYSFQDTNDLNPSGVQLLLVSNTLYGTVLGSAFAGGGRSANFSGALFKLNTDGSGFTNFYLFSPVDQNLLTNTDGANSGAQLVLSGKRLYGTAERGGFFANGAIFAINTDGTGFTNLHNFSASAINDVGVRTNTDGAAPTSGLVLSGNTLYGTTAGQGEFGGGTVFAIHTDGTGFTNLYNFTAVDSRAGSKSALILSSNTLYGTTANGGPAGNGTLYSVNTDGSDFSALHDFSALVRMTTPPYIYTNGDGAVPRGALVLSGDRLYGTTFEGGTNTSSSGTTANGTIFAINTDGSDFTILRHLSKNDGADMDNRLVLSGDILYGTALGGSAGGGTVFEIHTNGSGFALLESFTLPIGAIPEGDLVSSGSTLYGVTKDGGTNSGGAIYALDLAVSPPPIQFTATPTNGLVRLSVQFNAPAVDSVGNTITSWNWNFGDGPNSSSTVQNPVHIYTNSVTFQPTLSCINNFGNTVTGSGPAITVNPLPPIQFTASPTQGLPPPLTVHFTSPAQDAGGNNILFWNWDFGDGSSSPAQNPSHTYTNAGTYHPALACTNINHDASVGSGPAITVLNSLLLNGTFETGTFTNWTQSGYTNTTRVTTGSTFAHSGKYGAELLAPGAGGEFGFLSQTFPTTPGASYLLSFWLNRPFGSNPNDFQVSWNGNVLLDETNVGGVGWTNIQLNVTGSDSNSTLQFAYLTGALYYGLDDVGLAALESAVAVQPSISKISLSGQDIILTGTDGTASQTYYLLMSTNLAEPFSQWNRVATNIPGTAGNFSITATNAVNPNTANQFFILRLQ